MVRTAAPRGRERQQERTDGEPRHVEDAERDAEEQTSHQVQVHLPPLQRTLIFMFTIE